MHNWLEDKLQFLPNNIFRYSKYSDIFKRKLLVLIFLSQNPYGFYNKKNDFLYNLLFPLKAFNFFKLP